MSKTRTIERVQGKFEATTVGPVWGISVKIPPEMIGDVILIFCETRSGVFTVSGVVNNDLAGERVAETMETTTDGGG